MYRLEYSRGIGVSKVFYRERGSKEQKATRTKQEKKLLLLLVLLVMFLFATGTACTAPSTYEEQDAIEYSYEKKTLLMQDDAPLFSYPVITCTKENPVVDELNEQMKSAVEEAYNLRVLATDFDEFIDPATGELLTKHEACNYSVTFLSGDIVCVRISDYQTRGGPHGEEHTSCIIKKLDTGENLSPLQVAGITESQNIEFTVEAIQAYTRANPGAWEEYTTTKALTEAIEMNRIAYYVVPEGLVAACPSYLLGSFAYGHPHILVCDLEGNAVTTGEAIKTGRFEPAA